MENRKWFGENGKAGFQEAVKKGSLSDFTEQAYTKAWQIAREKRNEMLEYLEQGYGKEEKNSVPYDVPKYMGKICWLLRDLISEMAEIEKEYLSVSFFYKVMLESQDGWHQVTETEEVRDEQVKLYTKRKDTVFYRLLNEDRSYIYILDKKQSIRRGEYDGDNRDAMFENEGSVLAMKVDLEDTGKKYVRGILVISVYGKAFIEVDNCCRKWGRSFEYVMVYCILPYFKQLFQTECGMIYMNSGHSEAANSQEKSEL